MFGQCIRTRTLTECLTDHAELKWVVATGDEHATAEQRPTALKKAVELFDQAKAVFSEMSSSLKRALAFKYRTIKPRPV